MSTLNEGKLYGENVEKLKQLMRVGLVLPISLPPLVSLSPFVSVPPLILLPLFVSVPPFISLPQLVSLTPLDLGVYSSILAHPLLPIAPATQMGIAKGIGAGLIFGHHGHAGAGKPVAKNLTEIPT